jgi:hypothetical protein
VFSYLPDLLRLGELARQLGDGVIEAVVDAPLAKSRHFGWRRRYLAVDLCGAARRR